MEVEKKERALEHEVYAWPRAVQSAQFVVWGKVLPQLLDLQLPHPQ